MFTSCAGNVAVHVLNLLGRKQKILTNSPKIHLLNSSHELFLLFMVTIASGLLYDYSGFIDIEFKIFTSIRWFQFKSLYTSFLCEKHDLSISSYFDYYSSNENHIFFEHVDALISGMHCIN